ncbi:hypothetical protein GUITHDRAFT_136202 [Guillardia theta CCMP2712]|uniref:Armadillo repeat-containing domain-containing protein n=1 Tax=Guillardia theta (strain CCMP2712) TaxID=905079 RepID=L1JKI9_GUITC|nr:hypothetical protein GUITHDRAFT_136202 [Guillardia theta CCMP2712]EKX49016.1 hypothetical protein GUITHDRAFT_136202 [Guillardia theta CCMP2712]|eukprot:XP_005835996.1 hypothetical protein GUITHDRAFT_136202 [Guillardia theta CCMP2712]
MAGRTCEGNDSSLHSSAASVSLVHASRDGVEGKLDGRGRHASSHGGVVSDLSEEDTLQEPLPSTRRGQGRMFCSNHVFQIKMETSGKLKNVAGFVTKLRSRTQPVTHEGVRGRVVMVELCLHVSARADLVAEQVVSLEEKLAVALCELGAAAVVTKQSPKDEITTMMSIPWIHMISRDFDVIDDGSFIRARFQGTESNDATSFDARPRGKSRMQRAFYLFDSDSDSDAGEPMEAADSKLSFQEMSRTDSMGSFNMFPNDSTIINSHTLGESGLKPQPEVRAQQGKPNFEILFDGLVSEDVATRERHLLILEETCNRIEQEGKKLFLSLIIENRQVVVALWNFLAQDSSVDIKRSALKVLRYLSFTNHPEKTCPENGRRLEELASLLLGCSDDDVKQSAACLIANLAVSKEFLSQLSHRDSIIRGLCSLLFTCNNACIDSTLGALSNMSLHSEYPQLILQHLHVERFLMILLSGTTKSKLRGIRLLRNLFVSENMRRRIAQFPGVLKTLQRLLKDSSNEIRRRASVVLSLVYEKSQHDQNRDVSMLEKKLMNQDVVDEDLVAPSSLDESLEGAQIAVELVSIQHATSMDLSDSASAQLSQSFSAVGTPIHVEMKEKSIGRPSLSSDPQVLAHANGSRQTSAAAHQGDAEPDLEAYLAHESRLLPWQPSAHRSAEPWQEGSNGLSWQEGSNGLSWQEGGNGLLSSPWPDVPDLRTGEKHAGMARKDSPVYISAGRIFRSSIDGDSLLCPNTYLNRLIVTLLSTQDGSNLVGAVEELQKLLARENPRRGEVQEYLGSRPKLLTVIGHLLRDDPRRQKWEAAQLQFLDKQLLCLLKEICEGSATNVKRFASNTAAVLAVLHVLRRCRMINHQSSSWRASELDVELEEKRSMASVILANCFLEDEDWASLGNSRKGEHMKHEIQWRYGSGPIVEWLV